MPVFLALTGLVSSVAGFLGSLFIALSIGDPSKGQAHFAIVAEEVEKRRKRVFNFAVVISPRLWQWGVWLLVGAFVAQLPRVFYEAFKAFWP